jgi:mitochondrial fission protein ELM1
MSLKQKEEITVWVFKDGKKGHEKQTDALVNALSELKKVFVTEVNINEDWQTKLNLSKPADLLIGAGRKTHSPLLKTKKVLKKGAKTILLMKPNMPAWWFDLVIAPKFDFFLFPNRENLIRTDGVLAKYSNLDIEKNTGLIVIGGKSRHFHFRKKVLAHQLEWLINTKYPTIKWDITTSPRSPDLKMPVHKGNAKFYDWKKTSDNWLSEKIAKAEYTFLTPESVSTLYESLSTKTKTYVFHHEKRSSENGEIKTKVNKNIDRLKKNGQIGFIDTKRYFLSRSVKDIKLSHPSEKYHLNEATRVAKEILSRL